jgi:hypothetical protein
VEKRIVENLKKAETQKQRTAIVAAIKTGATDLGLQINLDLLKELEQQYAPEAASAKPEAQAD